MDKDKPKIHYCTILSDEQWDFILEGRFSVQRQRCLHRLMTNAVRTKTVCNIKGIGIALEVGEVAASDVELAEYLGCNRKTVGKLIDSFNRLGVLTTRTNNRTSIHTLHFLTGWYHRLMPKNRRTAHGHQTTMKCCHRTCNVPCRTIVNAENRKRTPRQAAQQPFLFPFVRLCAPTIPLTSWTARKIPTIPIS